MKIVLVCLCVATALAQSSYKIQLSNSRVIEVSAEEYVAVVVAGEVGVLQTVEARKAMAVAARTYAFRMQGRHKREGFDFCVTTHCQRALIGAKNDAAKATAGEMLWFDGRPALTVYSKDCGGRSELSSEASYLKVHDDPHCLRREDDWNWHADLDQLASALLAERLRCPVPLNRLEVVATTASGRAKTVRLSGSGASNLISASTLRFAAGRRLGWNTIRSDLYRIEGGIFIGRGQGHGIGLCQLGADEMGKEGLGYRSILSFYYPGTILSRAASGFEWTRLGGERVVVLTTTSNRDRPLVAEAERSLRWAETRLRQRASGTVEVRVYRDVVAFRDATGEPGWVAARADGSRVDMQPKAEQPSTLQHEMLHVILEQRAAPGLPAWFREGLVEYFSRSAARGTAPGNVQDRSDEAQARRGYGNALTRVKDLIQRYGETPVVAWVELGLPPEVKYSSSSSPVVNSR